MSQIKDDSFCVHDGSGMLKQILSRFWPSKRCLIYKYQRLKVQNCVKSFYFLLPTPSSYFAIKVYRAFFFLARSKIFIKMRLEKDFSFQVAGKYIQLKTINHLGYMLHLSCVSGCKSSMTTVSFITFSNLIQKRFGAKILLEVFSVLSWQGPMEVIKVKIILLGLRKLQKR